MTVTRSPQAAPAGGRRGPRDLARAGAPGRVLQAVPRAFWLGLAGLAGFAGLLEIAPRTGLVRPEYAPPTTRILAELFAQAQQPMLWTALGNTLTTWVIGLSIAVAAGLVLGVLIGSVPALRAVTASTIEFLRPIPSVAWIPVAIVLYGSSRTSTLILVVYAAFWQVLVQVLHGVVDVDPVARETARSYRLGRWARVRWLIWPTALPYVVTGVRLAVAVALILTVTGELLIGTPGLGNQISIATTSRAVPLTYALVLVTGLVGVAANLLARAAERRVLAWHPAQRKEAAAT